RRNRIIAGISDVTVVVEAALKGGALITADIAGSYNRDVFAFPGRTTDQYAEGCNFLIKTNRAGLIGHARDLVYYMGWDTVLPVDPTRQTPVLPGLSIPEMMIVNLLKSSELGIAELELKAGIQHNKLSVHLLNLEIKGVIIVRPGNIYQLI
ncbi:MAG TPA: DNA-processing protein DprA, partial [Pedobacter sp.]